MANPVIINPTLTLAGQAAAFNADNNGLELKIDQVSFGRAHYDPTGDEIGLQDPVGNPIPVTGASRPTPYQIRMVSTWRENVGQVGIGEIGFWSNGTLVFVWSKADGTVASYKTDGVAYVLFNDLSFQQVPAGSISFTVDPNESVALAALAAHEGADNAHLQYMLRAKFPDYQGHLWGVVSGGNNAIALQLPAIVELTEYIRGQRFTFRPEVGNSGPTTIDINGLGPVPVLKTGGVPLTQGSIIGGGIYDVYYDGENFQLTAGAGFASAEATAEELLQEDDTESTSWVSVRRLRDIFAKERGDISRLLATTEFVRNLGPCYPTDIRVPLVDSALSIDHINGLAGITFTQTIYLPTREHEIPIGSTFSLMFYSGTGVGTVMAPVGCYITVGNVQAASLKFTHSDPPLRIMYLGGGAYTLLGGGSLGNLPALQSVMGRTGWKKDASGIITQWGLTAPTSPTTPSVQVTFPVKFPTEVLFISEKGYYNDAIEYPMNVEFSFTELSTSGTLVKQIATIRGGTTPSFGALAVGSCSWIAVGR